MPSYWIGICIAGECDHARALGRGASRRGEGSCSVSLIAGSRSYRARPPCGPNRPIPPLSLEPESFPRHSPKGEGGLPLRWPAVAQGDGGRFPECPVRAVLLPERFRGGCSFGARHSPFWGRRRASPARPFGPAGHDAGGSGCQSRATSAPPPSPRTPLCVTPGTLIGSGPSPSASDSASDEWCALPTLGRQCSASSPCRCAAVPRPPQAGRGSTTWFPATPS